MHVSIISLYDCVQCTAAVGWVQVEYTHHDVVQPVDAESVIVSFSLFTVYSRLFPAASTRFYMFQVLLLIPFILLPRDVKKHVFCL